MITISIKTIKPVVTSPPQKGKWVIHGSSWDLYGKSRPMMNNAKPAQTNSLPDPFRHSEKNPNGKPTSIVLTDDLQHYFLYINMCSYTRRAWSKKEYFEWFSDRSTKEKREFIDRMVDDLRNGLAGWRSHTNNHGSTENRFVLASENLDKPFMLYAKLITGRARLRLKNDILSLRNIPGKGNCVAVECLSAKEDYWLKNPINNPEYFDMPLCTGWKWKYEKGTWTLLYDDVHIPYGIFNNRFVLPIMLPSETTTYVLYGDTRPMLSTDPLEKPWVRR